MTIKKHAQACFFVALVKRLTGVAIVAASKCVARAITVASRGVATAIATKASIMTAWLRDTLTMLPKIPAHAERMALAGVSIRFTVPMAVTFLASGMVVTAVWRTVVEAVARFAMITATTVVAIAVIAAAAVTVSTCTVDAALAVR